MLTLAMLLFSIIPATADDECTIAFEVGKMTCAACPITVRVAMGRVDGLKEVEVDLQNNIATVTYEPSVTTASDIAAASSNVGFPATVK